MIRQWVHLMCTKQVKSLSTSCCHACSHITPQWLGSTCAFTSTFGGEHLLENGTARVKSRNGVNYWDVLCLNLEAGALLFQARQDGCEPEAPMGSKTSASQNKGWGLSISTGHTNTVFKPAGLTRSYATAPSSSWFAFLLPIHTEEDAIAHLWWTRINQLQGFSASWL